MQKTFLTLMGMALAISVFSQNDQKEVGLLFRSLDSFGLTYRTGSDHAFWRFSGMSLYGIRDGDETSVLQSERTNNRYGVNLHAGREHRKPITPKFSFRYGADISVGYYYSKTLTRSGVEDEQDTEFRFTPGLNAILGLNFLINEYFAVGFELLPGVSYSRGKSVQKDLLNEQETTREFGGYSFGISDGAALSLVYRFNKKDLVK
jgi:hypothetical protein